MGDFVIIGILCPARKGLHGNSTEDNFIVKAYVYVNMHLSGALITIMFFMVLLQLVYAQTVSSTTGTIPTPQNPQSSDFGYYFQKRATAPAAPPPSYPTNTHTQKPVLTCDQPGHASCYDLGYSKGLLNTQISCSAATLNSFVIANPSQVNNFCSGYRVAAQQALQQQR